MQNGSGKLSDTSSYSTSQERHFLSDMHNLADWSGTSDADLLSSGADTCHGLDGGLSLSQEANDLGNAGATAQQASDMIVSSIEDLCPQYQSQLNAFMNS